MAATEQEKIHRHYMDDPDYVIGEFGPKDDMEHPRVWPIIVGAILLIIWGLVAYFSRGELR